MKVLFLVTAYPRHEGDVITPWLTETILRLAEVGVQVEVLAPSYRGSMDQTVASVRVHRFRYAWAPWETLTHDQTAPDRIREKPWYLLLVPSYLVSGIVATRRLARTGEFDVVHAFWPIPHGILGIAAKRATGIPLVITFFGVELSWLRSQFPVLAPILRWIVRSSDAVTAISTYTAGKLCEIAPTAQVEIVPFGAAVDAVPFPAGPTSNQRRSSYELLFVGRLVERKGVQHLIEALARLRRDQREVSLRIVGDGPFAGALRTRASELGVEPWVRFEGQIPRADLALRFAGCDAFVLPAVEDEKGDVEGLGVVLIEALLYERPVIASASGGIPDIVRHGRTGLLVEPGDSDALAAAVVEYMEDPERAREFAAAGRADVEARFGWPAIAGRLRDLYETVYRNSPALPGEGKVRPGMQIGDPSSRSVS